VGEDNGCGVRDGNDHGRCVERKVVWTRTAGER
jgi:hypothetical protein